MRRGWAIGLFALTALALGALFFVPLGMVISGGFWVNGRFTLRYLIGVFRDPVYGEGLWNSLRIAIGTSALATLIAMPLAWLSNRYEFPGKRLLGSLILAPMILPPFVGAIGLQQMLGRYGALNALMGWGPVDWLGRGRYWGVVLLQAFGLYPILYLNLVAAMANVDPSMEEAAENLGCAGFRKFRRVTFPLILPGFFAGLAIIFVWSFTELGTPLILNYTHCAPVQVFDALKEVAANPFPYALVFVMLSASVLLYAAVKAIFGQRAYAMQSKAVVGAAAREAGGWRGAAIAAAFAGVLAVALLPHIGVILNSLAAPGSWYRSVWPRVLTAANYAEALGHGMTLGGIRNSLLYSSLAVVVNLALGLAVAFVVVRSSLRARGALDALAMLPLAVPGLIMAFGYLALSARLGSQAWVRQNPFWRMLLDVRTNPTFFLVIAYAVRRVPYTVRAISAGLQQTSVVFEEAAANLGAGPWRTLSRITLPLISANLIAGALLAFAFSMLEVSDSLMLAQREDFYPITKTIYELFNVIGAGPYIASALGVWAMAFLAITILGAGALLGKRMGALFRM